MHLEGKTAVIIGAGQSPGETLWNGRAAALRFAQEGAKATAVDRRLAADEAHHITGGGAPGRRRPVSYDWLIISRGCR